MPRQGLERVARELRGEAKWDEPMARHTALRVGGPADLFIEPDDLLDLQASLATGKMLVDNGVAASAKDVNDVLTLGFFHLYGPVNDY